MALAIGKRPPDFKLAGSDGKAHSLKDYKGRPVAVYFYPQDDTPTCTVEACEFAAVDPKMKKAGAVVLGVSPDGLKDHAKFIEKFKLPFVLLADEGHRVTEAWGLWQEKTTFGRTYMGVKRTTVLVGPDGLVKEIWTVTRAKGHAAAVLDAVKGLSA
jgi:thioredoxin-dependent peroxiredoxin